MLRRLLGAMQAVVTAVAVAVAPSPPVSPPGTCWAYLHGCSDTSQVGDWFQIYPQSPGRQLSEGVSGMIEAQVVNETTFPVEPTLYQPTRRLSEATAAFVYVASSPGLRSITAGTLYDECPDYIDAQLAADGRSVEVDACTVANNEFGNAAKAAQCAIIWQNAGDKISFCMMNIQGDSGGCLDRCIDGFLSVPIQ